MILGITIYLFIGLISYMVLLYKDMNKWIELGYDWHYAFIRELEDNSAESYIFFICILFLWPTVILFLLATILVSLLIAWKSRKKDDK